MKNIINLLTKNKTADWILAHAKTNPGKRAILSSRQQGKDTFALTESLSNALLHGQSSIIITRIITEKNEIFTKLVEYTQTLKEEFPTLNIQINSGNHGVSINNIPIQLIAIHNTSILDMEMRGRRTDNIYISEPDRYTSEELSEIIFRCEMCLCINKKSNITLVGTRMKPWDRSIYNAVPIMYKRIFVDQKYPFSNNIFNINTEMFNREILNI